MQTAEKHLPCVLVLAGHDPSGGAGIQADIEAIASNGCHALPVITGLTVQNTRQFNQTQAIAPDLFDHQLQLLLDDISPVACKIGLLADSRIVEVIHRHLKNHPEMPVILDPVLASGSGTELADEELIVSIRELLLPQTTLLTPNSLEARRLSGAETELSRAADQLIEAGARHVLITGTHEKTETVVNSLYGPSGLIDTFEVERLSGEYHGSGCTLASAIAALMAHNLEIETAVIEAIRYTMESLKAAHQPGSGQMLPDRFFWSRHAD